MIRAGIFNLEKYQDEKHVLIIHNSQIIRRNYLNITISIRSYEPDNLVIMSRTLGGNRTNYKFVLADS